MFKAIITIDDKDLLQVFKAEDMCDKDRSSAAINGNKITVEAKDIIAFKATVNGIIKTIETYEKTSAILKK